MTPDNISGQPIPMTNPPQHPSAPDVTPTPMTDEASYRIEPWDAYSVKAVKHHSERDNIVSADFARTLERELIAVRATADRLRAEIAELKRWKDEQLLVESGWDVQAVGEALNLPFGYSIRAGILPAVQAQARELADQRATIARLRAALEQLEMWAEAIRRELLDDGIDLNSTNFAACIKQARAALAHGGKGGQ